MSPSKILVPTDFSKCALNASRYAVQMALQTDSSLLFVTGYQLPYMAADFGSAVDRDMIKLFEEESDENFNGLRKALPELSEVQSEYVSAMAQAKDVILRTVIDHKPDWVIMGTHGKGVAGQKLFGSITNSVIGSINVPLLAIPQKAVYRSPTTIALGCDFRLIDDFSIFNRLLVLLRQFNSELHLVHVSEHVGDIEVDESFEAQKLKDCFAEVHHYIHELADRSVETGLQNFVEKNNVDLLALVPRKHGLIDRLIGHSVTKNMTSESAIPILALPF